MLRHVIDPPVEANSDRCQSTPHAPTLHSWRVRPIPHWGGVSWDSESADFWPPSPLGENGTVRLTIKVQVRARHAGIAGWQGDVLKVAVREPALEDRANRAVCALLAVALEVAPGRIHVVTGHHATRKLIEIAGLDAAEARRRLAITLL